MENVTAYPVGLPRRKNGQGTRVAPLKNNLNRNELFLLAYLRKYHSQGMFTSVSISEELIRKNRRRFAKSDRNRVWDYHAVSVILSGIRVYFLNLMKHSEVEVETQKMLFSTKKKLAYRLRLGIDDIINEVICSGGGLTAEIKVKLGVSEEEAWQ